VHLWDKLENIQLRPEWEDVIRWRWTPDGRYNTRSAYQMLQQGHMMFPGANLIWGCWCL
jgi:hypothetical protein